jgi:hypothetical protein
MKGLHRSTFRTAMLGLLLGLAASPLLGQDDPTQEEKFKNGLLPTGTYSGPQTVCNPPQYPLLFGGEIG